MPLIPPGAARGRRPGALLVSLCSIGLLAGLTGCGHGQGGDRSGTPRGAGLSRPAVPVPTGAWAGGTGTPVRTAGSVLQIVAHPDDDLFFMNPETAQSLRSGRPLTTVYLTSGESDGVNAPRSDLPGAAAPARRPGERGDKAAYAEARQNGIRAAYAEMVTGDRSAPWKRSVLHTTGGGLAELDTLEGHPHVRLVWNLLREAGSLTARRPHSLYGLWREETAALDSQLTSGGPVRRPFRYTRAQLVDTLVGYLDRFRPTQVRMQDPTPGRLDRNGKYADHQDHFAGARFVQEALARYGKDAARGAAPHFTVQTYLGYFNGGLPHVLGGRAAREKLRALETYAWADRARRPCPYAAGCGDLKMVPRQQHLGWSHGIRHTGGDSVAWLRSGADGGLRAYSVLDGRIAVHRLPGAAGGGRGEPLLLPEAGIDPALTAVRLPDGRTALVGSRTVTQDGPLRYRKEIGWVTQRPGTEGFGPWQDLGSPESGDPDGLSDLSAPAVAVGPDGAVTVVVRTSRHRLAARVLPSDGSRPGPWRALGGSGIHGTPAATTDGRGRVHVFGTTAKTVLTWSAPRPGGPLPGPRPTGLPATAGPVTARPDGREGVRVYLRAPVSGHVLTARLTGPRPGTPPHSPAPTPRLTDLGGSGGYGPVAVTPLPGGRTLLAARAGDGDLQTAVVDERPRRAGTAPRAGSSSVRPVRPRWSTTGFLFAHSPGVLPAAGGRGADLVVQGLDGRLYRARADGRTTAGWHST